MTNKAGSGRPIPRHVVLGYLEWDPQCRATGPLRTRLYLDRNFRMGRWRRWERASMAWKRSRVRIPLGPPITQSLTSDRFTQSIALHNGNGVRRRSLNDTRTKIQLTRHADLITPRMGGVQPPSVHAGETRPLKFQSGPKSPAHMDIHPYRGVICRLLRGRQQQSHQPATPGVRGFPPQVVQPAALDVVAVFCPHVWQTCRRSCAP